ncbi:IS982 family transposase [candidate division KSB1 bacterium]|nr:IS982 family transposase [candidate division KSB1 bacterium]MCH9007468.1 IS982 family transposase [candidate division KSB1 bacterium]
MDNNGNIPKIGRNPKFSDVKVIALALAAEFLSMDSENRLFDLIKDSAFFSLNGLIERSAFNRRRRSLRHYFNTVLEYLSDKISPAEDAFIVDSFPIEVCRFARAKRVRVCKENFDTAPDYGYCAAQKNTYFGYKLHGLCGVSGVFKKIDLSKASIADIHYLQDIKEDISQCILIGDKAYLSSEIQLDLFQTQGVRLLTPKRVNQKEFREYPQVFRKLRKRIETLFSQLCDQFMIKRNYAKSFFGLATRIISKIVSLTLAQFVNKFHNKKPINEIKYAFS